MLASTGETRPPVSRPRELPPQPLLEPDVKLSLHPAPIKQMNLVFPFSSAQI
ncbi:hypothetical protein C8R30_1201, partial [Nitrosomonas nitrosa]